jgi:hypothetical protein
MVKPEPKEQEITTQKRIIEVELEVLGPQVKLEGEAAYVSPKKSKQIQPQQVNSQNVSHRVLLPPNPKPFTSDNKHNRKKANNPIRIPQNLNFSEIPDEETSEPSRHPQDDHPLSKRSLSNFSRMTIHDSISLDQIYASKFTHIAQSGFGWNYSPLPNPQPNPNYLLKKKFLTIHKKIRKPRPLPQASASHYVGNYASSKW